MTDMDDAVKEARDDDFVDVDRMINEGLGGGNVTINNGYIGDSTTDTMGQSDSILDAEEDKRVEQDEEKGKTGE